MENEETWGAAQFLQTPPTMDTLPWYLVFFLKVWLTLKKLRPIIENLRSPYCESGRGPQRKRSRSTTTSYMP